MSKYKKIKKKVMSGETDANITKDEIEFFLEKIGATHKRTSGSHHQYGIDGIEEQFNLQFIDGKAKAYQIKQIRKIVNKYKLGQEED